jgi:hypothetical protein
MGATFVAHIDEDCCQLDFLKGVLEGLRVNHEQNKYSIKTLSFIIDEIENGETIEFWKSY